MSDTTIPALLEELREVEPLLWEKITYLDQGDRVIKFAYQVLDDFALDHLQGCIQRAIAARKWCGWVGNTEKVYFSEIQTKGAASRLENHEISFAQADTPAAAILAAYIEAKRARQ